MSSIALSENYFSSADTALRELRFLVRKDSNARIFFRLACHDAATFCTSTRTGGANGSITVSRELAHEDNMGLDEAVKILEPIKELCSEVTFADLIQIAGAAAVESLGGPSVSLRLGRRDSKACPPRGRLPTNDKLSSAFTRMGLSVRDMVVLTGALGGLAWAAPNQQEDMAAKQQGYTKFDNSLFRQFVEGETGGSPLVAELVASGGEEARCLVQLYSRDQEKFFADYAQAHCALSELGCSKCNLTLPPAVTSIWGSTSVGEASGVDVSTALQPSQSWNDTAFLIGSSLACGAFVTAVYYGWKRKKLPSVFLPAP